jgi:hypothetical protein
MRGVIRQELGAGWPLSSIASSRKHLVQTSLQDWSEFANLGRLCYNATLRDNLQRNSFRSLLAKTLRRNKLGANMRIYQNGTAFATGDAGIR